MEAIVSSERTFGVSFPAQGEAQIGVWAPLAEKVAVEIMAPRRQVIALQPRPYGYWTAKTEAVKPGSLYYIHVDEKKRPDPASLSQPEGVHGPSEAVDVHTIQWTDGAWKGLTMEEMVIYELHVGTFTREGTFDGVISKLDYLADLGVNAVEIMPVAQFPGRRNWGYDGVFPYAVQHSYGGGQGLARLVNACHEKGMAVILDVVYNHLGPEGNFLKDYGPFFTDKYKTPWGEAVNFDDAYADGVRRFWIENALMWLRDFHVDALRLDAVHAIMDFGAVHFLKELKENVRRLEKMVGRRLQLIAECDLNDVRYLNPFSKGGYHMDAQWTDEFHHALHALITGERMGYYEDFGEIGHLEKSYRDAYVYDGLYSPHRKRTFGIKANGIPGHQFVVFAQNHDHVGNRMLGDRLGTLVSFEMQKLAAGAVFVSPYVPLLFMGEEYDETNPFLYFVSHSDPDLIEAVRKGRKAEFASFHQHGEAPDPQAEETFQRSKLSWNFKDRPQSFQLRRFYRKLIALRKHHPVLRRLDRRALRVKSISASNLLILERWHGTHRIICFLNFSGQAQTASLPAGNHRTWTKLLDSAETEWAGPGSTVPGKGESDSVLELPPESIIIYTIASYD